MVIARERKEICVEREKQKEKTGRREEKVEKEEAVVTATTYVDRAQRARARTRAHIFTSIDREGWGRMAEDYG